VLAHGGIGGAIVEIAGVLALVALGAVVWLRERRARRDDRG
jgi:hypothetical protein